jgi:methionine sulfoxide reductase heme-binding subunit
MHMLALGADKFTAFTMTDLLIPFHSGTREPWTGLGIIAAWLLLLMAASFPLRRLTGYRFWRKAHWLTLPLMAIGLAHGIGGGSDTTATPMRITYVVTGTLVVFLVLYRALLGRRDPTPLITARPMPLDRMTSRSPRTVGQRRPA